MMIRVLYLLSILAFITVTHGCNADISPGADVDHATPVTFAKLKEIVQSESFERADSQSYFWWVGSDKDFHYFETEKGFYRLSTEFKMPRFQRQIDQYIAREVKPGTLKTRVFINGDSITYRSSRPEEKTAH